MKKLTTLFLVLIIMASLISACGTSSPSAPAAPALEQPSAEKVKTGFAITTSLSKSTDAGEKDGLAEADSIIVAVMVDAAGKIVDCVIDMAQSKAGFNTKGEILIPLDSEFKTKNELGPEYGMSKASSLGKEWNEQAATLADYVVGKTAAEVQGIAVDESGHATGSDLTSSVTVSISGYVNAIVQAVNNAKEIGASAGDKLGVGTATNIEKSKNAAGAENGRIQFYSTYTAVTTDASGKITSCVIDATQSNIDFDASGKIVTDLAAAVKTKNELGDAYGMKKNSGIGKEWNEQAAAFAKYVTGKTVAEVEGLAVDEEGHATGSDVTASTTVGIADFKVIIAKASK